MTEPSRSTDNSTDARPPSTSNEASDPNNTDAPTPSSAAPSPGPQPSSSANLPESEDIVAPEDDDDITAEAMAVDGDAHVVDDAAAANAARGRDGRPGGADDEEEEEGEDLFGDDMVNDYRPLEQLDHYEVDDAAENEAAPAISAAARRRAESEMRRRDRRDDTDGGGLAMPGRGGLLNADDSDEDEDGGRSRRRRRGLAAAAAASAPSPGGASVAGSDAAAVDASQLGTPGLSLGAEADADAEPFDLDAHAVSGRPVSAIIEEAGARAELLRRLSHFLRNFADEKSDALVYMDRIRLMAANNLQSLVVNFRHLSVAEPTVGVWLADAPTPMLQIFDEAATKVTMAIFPEYRTIAPEIFVRVADLPVSDNLRDIRHIHLNTLIKVTGVVTRRSSVFPHLRMVRLTCQKCQAVLSPTASATARPERSIRQCPECGANGPFTVNSEESLFGNFQKVNLQESPGSVPAGRLPRYKEVILLNDLIDSARPGEEVEVTGIYRHNVDPSINIMNGFPVFSTVIEANHVRKLDDGTGETELTDEDVAEIRKLAKDPRIAERVFASMAPSIYGHPEIKRALALALFGGQEKDVGEKHHIRGDINMLMMGDPGTAKSQFLKYVEKTANRAVYATGKGASAVGLTAAVHRDPVTREWTLEGGALVLADRGVCLIDEFDKMNDADRTSIHEAMEQQSISISKAGIVTTLQARCSVIAAANPVKGRYDASLSFFDNVDLTEPILSRFDVLCVVRDIVDSTQDETLAKFVVDSHMRSHPTAEGDVDEDMAELAELDEEADDDGIKAKKKKGDDSRDGGFADVSAEGVEVIPQDMLRKYLLYAKTTVAPKLSNMDKDKVSSLYIELRKESMASGGMPIALRHLESIVRLSEAHARLHLREYVREDDINTAIAVMLESFFASQKFSIVRQLRRKFHKFIAYRKDDNELLFYVLSGLVRDYAATQAVARAESDGGGGGELLKRVEVDLDDFEARAREMNVYSCDAFYKSKVFAARRFSIDRERGKIVKTM